MLLISAAICAKRSGIPGGDLCGYPPASPQHYASPNPDDPLKIRSSYAIGANQEHVGRAQGIDAHTVSSIPLGTVH